MDQFAGVGLEKLARLDMARAADMAKESINFVIKHIGIFKTARNN